VWFFVGMSCPFFFCCGHQFPCPSWSSLDASQSCAVPLCRSRTSCHCRKLDLLGFLIVNENPRLMSCWIPGPIKMANLRCWEHKKVRPSSGAQQYLLACVLCVALHYCIALLDCCLAWYGTVPVCGWAAPPERERRS
jgi:hypothetical protein